MSQSCPRRRFVRNAAFGISCLPLILVARRASAKTSNPELRAKFAYQPTPLDGKSCASCLEFEAGDTPTAPGKCKVIPGDDEISPDAYCSAYNTL